MEQYSVYCVSPPSMRSLRDSEVEKERKGRKGCSKFEVVPKLAPQDGSGSEFGLC